MRGRRARARARERARERANEWENYFASIRARARDGGTVARARDGGARAMRWRCRGVAKHPEKKTMTPVTD
jgi:hypothetical protein